MQQIIFGLITPTLALVFTATFLLLWKQGQMGRHVLAFAAAYALLGTGFIIVHFDLLPNWLNFHVTQAIYSLTAVLLVWGTCKRVGVTVSLPILGAIYATFALALLPVVMITEFAAPRLVMTNIGYGTMLVVGIMALLSSPRRALFDKLVIIVLALNAADFLIRPTIIALSEEAFVVAAYRDTVYYSIINLALTVKSLTTALVLIGACLHDRFAQMKEESQRDGLTGLRNRRAFESEVDVQLARAAQEKVPVSVVVADIDHFKQVNDIWGHQAGDAAIAAFGKLIADMVREDDVCGRIGGEEFCILVWDCPESAATRLAERIRACFAQLSHSGIGEEIRLSASFGVAEWQGGESYHKIFSRADAALYCAKKGGRNRVEIADPVGAISGRRAGDQPETTKRLAAA